MPHVKNEFRKSKRGKFPYISLYFPYFLGIFQNRSTGTQKPQHFTNPQPQVTLTITLKIQQDDDDEEDDEAYVDEREEDDEWEDDHKTASDEEVSDDME